MRNFHNTKPFIYALVAVLTIWLVIPAIAGNGDPEAAKQAWPMIQDGALVIDVRTKEEFAGGHLDGAINIEWDQTDALVAAIGNDKQREVVLYCRSGNRSGKSLTELQSRGYTHLFNATGLEALQATKPAD